MSRNGSEAGAAGNARDEVIPRPGRGADGALSEEDKDVAPTHGATQYDGLTDDEIFRRITRPPDLPGVRDWGIPPETDESCDPALSVGLMWSETLRFAQSPLAAQTDPSRDAQVKVANFLEMKHSQGMHINTTLLSSTAFANPHIYAKLVRPAQSVGPASRTDPPSRSSLSILTSAGPHTPAAAGSRGEISSGAYQTGARRPSVRCASEGAARRAS